MVYTRFDFVFEVENFWCKYKKKSRIFMIMDNYSYSFLFFVTFVWQNHVCYGID